MSGEGGVSVCWSFQTLELHACVSSLRYKTDVQSFFGGLDIVKRLRPITFTWKEGGMRDLGFAAEEVEKVEPLLTFRNAKGEIEGVNYSQVNVVLVNAIKEQQTQIAQQQAQVKGQQEQIERHEQQTALQQQLIGQQQTEIDGLKRLICLRYPKETVCKQERIGK